MENILIDPGLLSIFFRSSHYISQSMKQHQASSIRSDKAIFISSNEVGSGYTEIPELSLLTSVRVRSHVTTTKFFY